MPDTTIFALAAVLGLGACKRVEEEEATRPAQVPAAPGYLDQWRIVGGSRDHLGETVSVCAQRERRSAVVGAVPFRRVIGGEAAGGQARFWYSAVKEHGAACEVRVAAERGGVGVKSAVRVPRRQPSAWQEVRIGGGTGGGDLTVEVAAAECGGGPVWVAISEVSWTAGTGLDAGAGAGLDAGADTGADTGTGLDAGADTGAGTGTGTGTVKNAGEGTTTTHGATNVMLIVIDTLRFDHLDCSAATAEVAPNVTERLCTRGTFFENAFSTTSWTYPALASLLSGQLPHQHGAMRLDGRGQREVRRETVLLPEIFRWAGFETAAVVANWQGGRGLWRGFDWFFEQHAYRDRGSREVRRAGRAVEQTLAWLDGRDPRRPFFFWLLLIDLHEPVDAALKHRGLPAACEKLGQVPYRWRGLEAGRRGQVTATKERKMSCRRALYGEAVSYVDAQLGRLLDRLEQTGLDRQTALILVSDHGEEFWDHKAVESSGGVGHGYTLYAEQVHVPVLVVPPRGRETGTRRRSELVSLTDLFATTLGVAGVRPPVGTASRDLGPATRGAPLPAVGAVLSETTMYGPDRWAVTTERLRAIRTGDDRLDVFDRRVDPLEQAPLPADHALHQRGVELLRQHFAAGPAAVRFTDDDLDALRALGYVE